MNRPIHYFVLAEKIKTKKLLPIKTIIKSIGNIVLTNKNHVITNKTKLHKKLGFRVNLNFFSLGFYLPIQENQINQI